MGRGAPRGRRAHRLSPSAADRSPPIATLPVRMSDQTPDIADTPPVPPEVEQAAMLGNVKDAVTLYVKHTGVDDDLALAVVEQLAE